jgi:CRP-like cAMP-binding protein
LAGVGPFFRLYRLPLPLEVLNNSRFWDFVPGDILFRAGEARDDVFLVESGLLRLDRQFPDGSRSVRILGPGEFAGEDALMGTPYSQQLKALTFAGVWVTHVSRVRLPLPVVRWLLAQVTQQLQQNDSEIQRLHVYSAEIRVRQFLVLLFEKSGGREIPVTQSDFAQLVGATRETVSVCLNRLAREGLIRLSRGSITVLQPGLLDVK